MKNALNEQDLALLNVVFIFDYIYGSQPNMFQQVIIYEMHVAVVILLFNIFQYIFEYNSCTS